MNNQPVLNALNLHKSYQDGSVSTPVLHDINLQICKGDRAAITGRSGCGKSTLLHLLGGLDTPSSGQIELAGQDLNKLSNKTLSRLRNQQLGFVYQFHYLLPEFNAIENVAMPLVIGGQSPQQATARAHKLLDKVGLGHRLQHKPAELSGGERQRAAIARALITQPACLLADEPTGNLDQNTAQAIFDLLMALNDELGTALVVATHDQQLASQMQRVLTISDGYIS